MFRRFPINTTKSLTQQKRTFEYYSIPQLFNSVEINKTIPPEKLSLSSILHDMKKQDVQLTIGERFLQFADKSLSQAQEEIHFMNALQESCQLDKQHCDVKDYDEYIEIYNNLETLKKAADKYMRWDSDFRTKLNQLNKNSAASREWRLFFDKQVGQGIYFLVHQVLEKIRGLQPVYFKTLVQRYKTRDKKELLALLFSKLERLYIPRTSLDEMQFQTEIQALQAVLYPNLAKVVVINHANAGAISVLLSAKKQGRSTALICENKDKHSVAAKMADEVYFVSCIQNLNECMAIAAHIKSKHFADYQIGLHPVYGLHSEDPALPAACEKEGITFIGPNKKSMQVLGSKVNARRMASSLNVPVIPGYDGENQSREFLKMKAAEIGFPLVIKAAHGGGGTTIREANRIEDLDNIFKDFANEELVLEKLISEEHKHIEVQLLGNVILGMRNCSIQRDKQKYIEYGTYDIEGCEKLKDYARDIANYVVSENGFNSLATIEFLVTKTNFYFLEVNPRLQVEHKVTEDTLENFDLIGAQLFLAEGKSLNDIFGSDPQAEIDEKAKASVVKCSIQARINAVEFIYDHQVFMMGTSGKVTDYQQPADLLGCGDIISSIEHGQKVDTLAVNTNIAIVRGWGKTKEQAVNNLKDILNNLHIEGISTNMHYVQFTLEEIKRGAEMNNKNSGKINKDYDETIECSHRIARRLSF